MSQERPQQLRWFVLLVAYLLAVACATSGTLAPQRAGLVPHLWAAASSNDHRIVVERACGLDHCLSRVRVEWLEFTPSGEVRVVGTASVIEINESAHIFVSSVEPILDIEGTLGFRLAASNTYTREPIPIVIVPGEVGSYSFERE